MLRDFEIKNAARGEVTAVFATFLDASGQPAIDLDGDVHVPGCFTNGASVAISAFEHGSWSPGNLPVGKGVIRATPREAVMDGAFFMSTTSGRETFDVVRELHQSGLGEWSYSLRNVKSSRGTVNGRSVRMIEQVLVNEVSPVLAGAAGPGRSRTLAVKGLGGDEAADDLFANELVAMVARDGPFAGRSVVVERAEQLIRDYDPRRYG